MSDSIPTHSADTTPARSPRAEVNQQLRGWMQDIAAGDQAVFTQLYDQTNRQIYGFLVRMLKNPAVAEDVLLNVYVQVWRQAAHYDQARGAVLSWLMTIARSRALDHLRAARYQQYESQDLEIVSLTVATENVTPEEGSLLGERQQLLRAALTHLTPEQRTLIETAYFEGLSHSELAERFDLPLGTVKTRIRSGMSVLRKELSGLAA